MIMSTVHWFQAISYSYILDGNVPEGVQSVLLLQIKTQQEQHSLRMVPIMTNISLDLNIILQKALEKKELPNMLIRNT